MQRLLKMCLIGMVCWGVVACDSEDPVQRVGTDVMDTAGGTDSGEPADVPGDAGEDTALVDTSVTDTSGSDTSTTDTSAPDTRVDPCSLCTDNQVCVEDACVCDTGFADCDDDLSNGCEAELATDLNHCGACDALCDPTPLNMVNATCDAGNCVYDTCAQGFDDCDSDLITNGCEINLTSDINNCGACDTTCTVQAFSTDVDCADSACVITQCEDGRLDCDTTYANGCERGENQLSTCGGCDLNCINTISNVEIDDMLCVETTPSVRICDYGQCGEGFSDCDSDRQNGCERATFYNEASCGDCSTTCDTDQHCWRGLCDRIVAIEASRDTTCVLRELGSLTCWGDPTDGAFGDPGLLFAGAQAQPTHADTQGVILDSLVGYAAPSRGAAFCGLAQGRLFCWGKGLAVLDPARNVDADEPTQVDARLDWAQVELGDDSGLLVDDSGRLYFWGRKHDRSDFSGVFPEQVTGFSGTPTSLAAGADHSCFVTDGNGTGFIYCFGKNDFGQLADGTNTYRAAPALISFTNTLHTSIDAGAVHNCSLHRIDPTTGCWGNNLRGEIGDDDATASERIRWTGSTLPSGVTLTQLKLGQNLSCGIADGTGAVYCWGDNAHGQLGVLPSSAAQIEVPTAIPGVTGAIDLAVGAQHVCALLDDDSVMCWGRNEMGQLGIGSIANAGAPPVPPSQVVGFLDP